MREDDEEQGDFGELLTDLDDETADDEGDDPSLAPTSPELDEVLDEEALDDDTPHGLDLGADSVLPEEADDAGDAAGLDEPLTGDTEPEDTLPADDEGRDGIDDGRPLVSDLDLPGLDADEAGTEEDASRFGELLAASELELPHAPATRLSTRLSPELERCGALAMGGGAVVAGSTDLLWLDPGRSTPVRVALEGTRILSLALLGEQDDVVVAITSLGRILRRARLTSDAERVGELTHVADLGGSEARGIELATLGRDRPRTLVARLATGVLAKSDDLGAGLRPLEPRLVARALSPGGGPITALGEDGAALLLSPDGRSFERSPLDQVARAVSSGAEPFIVAAGELVAIADTERGLVLSRDGGRTFREVRGCASATACVIGRQADRDCLWLALYSEARDTTRLVELDVTSEAAQVIATITGAGDDESEVGAPGARITALGWDGARLYAAGEPGLLMFEPNHGNPAG